MLKVLLGEPWSVAPVRSGRLPEQLYERLVHFIASEPLMPGARLPSESELVSTFKVSRQVIREAIARLQAEGLVVTRQGAGSFLTNRMLGQAAPVTLPAGTALARHFEYRRALEGEAAALAAQRWTEADRAEIEEAARKADLNPSQSEREFHLAVARASRNPLFAEALAGLLGPCAVLGAEDLPPSEPACSQALPAAVDRRAIMEAIFSGNPEAARDAMRDCLERMHARAVARPEGASVGLDLTTST